MKKMYPLAIASLAGLALSGCDWSLINPAGYVAQQQSNLMIASVWIMLLVIVPVMFLILYYSWKYRDRNQSDYDAEFYHSNKLEVVIWGAPICIIIMLALITWGSTHLLDPYRPLVRIDSKTQIAGYDEDLGAVKRLTVNVIDPSRSNDKVVSVEPLVIEVAALDWKWLFIYPEQGIATVNELYAPVNRPITFKITSASMMNSFFIPDLAGQIYAMPGMQTRLHAVMNKEGKFKGFSGNYTGHGFSRMYFFFHSVSDAAFDEWVAKVRTSPKALDRNEYLALDEYSQKDERGHVQYFGIHHYGTVEDRMFHAILNMCVTPGMMCAEEMMSIDLQGGVKDEAQSRENYKRLRYDQRRTLKNKLDLAEFTGVMPGDLICTTDTQDIFPRLQSSAPVAGIEGKRASLDLATRSPIL